MKTKRIAKVLIALDYNPTAQKVAEEGFSMAKALKAEVILLHVITDPVFYSSAEYSPIMGYTGNMGIVQQQADSVEGLVKASQLFLDTTKFHLGDDTIQTKIKEGEFAEVILQTAKEVRADIIVMGSHSRRWLENILMGSVSEYVLRHTPIPLFIIPTRYKK